MLLNTKLPIFKIKLFLEYIVNLQIFNYYFTCALMPRVKIHYLLPTYTVN